jgi:chromosome segregation ATPase
MISSKLFVALRKRSVLQRHAQNKAVAADRRAELAERSKAQIEADIAYWKKNADDLNHEVSKADGEISKQKSKADTLTAELEQAQKEKNKLIDSLKQATKCPPAIGK